MSNKPASFPFASNPQPLYRHGGRLASTAELAVHPLGDDYAIEGSGTISALPAFAAGVSLVLTIVGNPTFKSSARLICPNSRDYLASALDLVIARSQGDGIWALYPIHNPATKILTGVAPLASPYAAQRGDDTLIVKQVTGAPFTITVDWSTRSRPLTIVDGKGDAATNNITITPASGQSQLASVNFSYVIDGNGGSITLTPLPDGSGAY
jgi:hypothetical protein